MKIDDKYEDFEILYQKTFLISLFIGTAFMIRTQS